MTLEQITQLLKPVVAEWPLGAVVYHRANGSRGVLVEYVVAADGQVRLMVAFGPHGNEFAKCCTMELTASKPASGDDGEEWKTGGFVG